MVSPDLDEVLSATHEACSTDFCSVCLDLISQNRTERGLFSVACRLFMRCSEICGGVWRRRYVRSRNRSVETRTAFTSANWMPTGYAQNSRWLKSMRQCNDSGKNNTGPKTRSRYIYMTTEGNSHLRILNCVNAKDQIVKICVCVVGFDFAEAKPIIYKFLCQAF